MSSLGEGSESEVVAQAEGIGETVGEAKWAALRELERELPGLDKQRVSFTVLSEGERGLLGVGFVEARVLASLHGPSGGDELIDEPHDPSASGVEQLIERMCAAIGARIRVAVHVDADSLRAVIHGGDLGLVIGRRGQTIDAIQHLVAAIVARGEGGPREVVVDAAGYRERRRVALEALADRTADRALASGFAIHLEPMTAAERKIVHVRLQDRPGIRTESEGTEPNRYVVVHPAE